MTTQELQVIVSPIVSPKVSSSATPAPEHCAAPRYATKLGRLTYLRCEFDFTNLRITDGRPNPLRTLPEVDRNPYQCKNLSPPLAEAWVYPPAIEPQTGNLISLLNHDAHSAYYNYYRLCECVSKDEVDLPQLQMRDALQQAGLFGRLPSPVQENIIFWATEIDLQSRTCGRDGLFDETDPEASLTADEVWLTYAYKVIHIKTGKDLAPERPYYGKRIVNVPPTGTGRP